MVKVRYYHNHEEVDPEVYKAALIILGMNGSGKKVYGPLLSKKKKVYGPSKPTCRFIQSPQKHVDNVVEQQSSGSTSSNIVNEERPPINVNEPPPEDDQPKNSNNEQVIEAGESGGAPAMPPVPAIVNIIGACSPPFEKQLTKSDVTEGQGRLTLRKEFVNLYLAPMFTADENLITGIDVTAFDAEGRQYDMTFKLWASKLYVLMKGWKEFYKTNNLTKAGEYVTLWMFRHVATQKLCFAITHARASGP